MQGEFEAYYLEESREGIHANQVRKCRGIHLWTLTTIKFLYLSPLSSFAMEGENLLTDSLLRRGLEKLRECTNPLWGIRKQDQGWLRLLNSPWCFYLSKAHPLPLPQAVSGTKFPSSHIASAVVSTQTFVLLALLILSKCFKARLSLRCSQTSLPNFSRISFVHCRLAVGSAPNHVSRTICFSNFQVSLYRPAQPSPGTCSPNTKPTHCAKMLSSPPLLSWVNSLSSSHAVFPFGCRIAAASFSETKATGNQSFVPGRKTKNSPSVCFLIFRGYF